MKPLKSVIVPSLLFAVPFFAPSLAISSDSATALLTTATVMFAILIGFFIANATSNYLRLQTLIAEENASLIALYEAATTIDPMVAAGVRDAIDAYMIAQLDHELSHADYTTDELNAVVQSVNSIVPTHEPWIEIFPTLYDLKAKIYATSQEIRLAARRDMTWGHWVIVALLSVIIGLALLSIRDGTIVSTLSVSLIFLSIYYTIMLIDALDGNHFLADKLGLQNPQRVFTAIGALPYYPEPALRKIKHGLPKEYRLGHYKNPGHSFEKEIRIVRA